MEEQEQQGQEQEPQELTIDPTTGLPIVPEEPTPPQQDAGEVVRMKERLAELSRRNEELTKLVNYGQRIDGLEQHTQQVAQAISQAAQQQNQQNNGNETDRNWGEFLGPKMLPILEQREAPLRNALIGMADQLDYTQTLIEFPEYKDPATQQEVEKLRQDRHRASGQLFSRRDVMIYITGQKARDPQYLAELVKKQEDDKRAKESARSSSYVNTDPAAGGGRRETISKPFADMSVEEMEKFMAEKRF